MNNPKVLLVIMDGWGFRNTEKGNAVRLAKTPTFDYLWENYSHTLLNAFGENVGLPWGIIGSSEVGHTSIGSGKLLYQEIYKINDDIEVGRINVNPALIESINFAKKNKGVLHFIGMLSDAGVHSHQSHLFALLQVVKRQRFKNNIYLHIITDGRDTQPQVAKNYIGQLQREIKKIGVNAQIASVSGRYFAMDRNSNWDRTKKAFLTITKKQGEVFDDPLSAIDVQYEKDVTDEFIEPVVIKTSNKKAGLVNKILHSEKPDDTESGTVKPGDGVIFWNFRSERMRQITELMLFKRNDIGTSPPENIKVVTLTTYNELLPVSVMYPDEKVKSPLAKILSDNKFSQGHFAETEKYAHVSYFFDGGNTTPFSGEKWYLIPSPRVATYDLKPEMSAAGITAEILAQNEKNKFDFIIVNYANADMVGHSGKLDATIKAVETIDVQLKKLMEFLPETYILITADHGNAECMVDEATGGPDKNHSVNPVPFIIAHPDFQLKNKQLDNELQTTGILADIAPTILQIFNIQKPDEMTGTSLFDTLKVSPEVENKTEIS